MPLSMHPAKNSKMSTEPPPPAPPALPLPEQPTATNTQTLPPTPPRTIKSTLSLIFRRIRPYLLVIFLIFSLIIGIVTGIVMRNNNATADWTSRQFIYFKFPGDLLMRALKALVLPLIVSSLISGLASLDLKTSGKIGVYSIVYYVLTTCLAVINGIILVTSIQPGFKANSATNQTAADKKTEQASMGDSFLDLLRNLIPDNIVEAAFRQSKTKLIPITNSFFHPDNHHHYHPHHHHNHHYNPTLYDISVIKEDGSNVLGLVLFSLALGVAVAKLGELGRPFAQMCTGLAEASMILVTLVIWYSPIGIIFLIAHEIIRMDNPMASLFSLGWYMLTVLVGLLTHGFIVLPLIYFIAVRKNPFRYMLQMSQAMLTAFGTASSSATLPVTYRCLEDNLKVDRRVTRFMLPVGATINMDGTALYEAVAAIFIAQANHLHLNIAQILAVSLTATLASIGAASIPQAGLVTMVIVLSAVGLPAEEVTKILAIDWLLDRFRTAINVEGDAIGAGIVHHLCRKQLDQGMEDPTGDDEIAIEITNDGHDGGNRSSSDVRGDNDVRGGRRRGSGGGKEFENRVKNGGHLSNFNKNSTLESGKAYLIDAYDVIDDYENYNNNNNNKNNNNKNNNNYNKNNKNVVNNGDVVYLDRGTDDGDDDDDGCGDGNDLYMTSV
ncbi:hypothetical protein HELRODRAFT_110739 [Helobdella robusta]|uniref:Amino acid transporter n=1 Tax=Helobdella robusta TaxID=6412 RepID=T1EF49_HELRO|nr:hypothetical protein HELRODRAFT_110739 [Helobdella robusta]ESO07255.1 hypothetical protein HELRODRAFT_110739 [Helobdella robusta]